MCWTQTELAKICALYYFGFAFGIFLSWMPDKFGRKGSMKILMPVYLIAQYMILFPEDLNIKRIGYFMQGALHIRLTIAISHMNELASPNNKDFSVTVMAMYDSGGLGLASLFLLFVKNDITIVLKGFFTASTTATVIYFLIIPESP